MNTAEEALEIMVDGQRLEQIHSFVNFMSRVTNNADCEVKLRRAMVLVVVVKLTKMWGNK